jgi:hypothetical protein
VLIRGPERAARARREVVARPPVRSLLSAPVAAIIVVVATAELTTGGWVFPVCGGVALAGVAVATPILGRHRACIRDGVRQGAHPTRATEQDLETSAAKADPG